MAIEHFMSQSPMGVITLCQEWFDADCPVEDAIAVAKRAWEFYTAYDLDHPHISSSLVWLKSRLLERSVFWHAPPYEPWVPYVPPDVLDADDPGPGNWARSGISATMQLLQPINRTAAIVVDDPGHYSHCPHCNRFFRNGFAKRLHIAEAHP